MALQPLVITKDSPVKQRSIREKQYELSDHLGIACLEPSRKVRVVLSDVKEGDWNVGTSTNTNYRPELLSRADYYAFGSLLPGRNYSSGSYRFGFNGQEKDDEVFGATGTGYTAEFWHYDPRVARRWNLDPKPQIYISDYAAFGLNPILNVDPNGAWFWESTNARQGRAFAKATGGIFSKSNGNASVDVSGIPRWGEGGDAVSYTFRKGQDRTDLLFKAKVDENDVFSSQKSGMNYLLFNTLEKGDDWMKGRGNGGQPPDLIKAIVAINPLVGIPDALSTLGLGEDLWGGDADTYTDKTLSGVGLAIPGLKALRPLVLTKKALSATEKATKVVDVVNSGTQLTNDAGGLDWLKDLEK